MGIRFCVRMDGEGLVASRGEREKQNGHSNNNNNNHHTGRGGGEGRGQRQQRENGKRCEKNSAEESGKKNRLRRQTTEGGEGEGGREGEG